MKDYNSGSEFEHHLNTTHKLSKRKKKEEKNVNTYQFKTK